MSKIVHRGTEPEGIKIGDQLGVRYDGVQEGIGDIPSVMLFTDVKTGSTFAANTPGEAKTRLAAMRALWRRERKKRKGTSKVRQAR